MIESKWVKNFEHFLETEEWNDFRCNSRSAKPDFLSFQDLNYRHQARVLGNNANDI